MSVKCLSCSCWTPVLLCNRMKDLCTFRQQPGQKPQKISHRVLWTTPLHVCVVVRKTDISQIEEQHTHTNCTCPASTSARPLIDETRFIQAILAPAQPIRRIKEKQPPSQLNEADHRSLQRYFSSSRERVKYYSQHHTQASIKNRRLMASKKACRGALMLVGMVSTLWAYSAYTEAQTLTRSHNPPELHPVLPW